MGTANAHALGRSLRFFAKKETTVGSAYGTDNQEAVSANAVAGADACKVLASGIEFTVEQRDRNDSRTTRQMLKRIAGKQDVTWSCESYLLPAGSTTAPDLDGLIECAMGAAFSTNSYSLGDTLSTARIMRTASGVFREDLFGAWVEEMKISASGGDEPKLSFSGGAFNYALTGTSTSTGTPDSDTIPVTTGEGVNFMVGSVIDVNGDTTVVTSKSAADTLEVKSGTYATAEDIIPTTYTEATLGDPINGIGGSLVLDSQTLPITAFDVTLTNGVKAINDEAFEKGTSDFIPGFRSVKGSVTVRARIDFIKALAKRYTQLAATDTPTFSDLTITVTLGNVSGKQCVVTLNNCELEFGAIDLPESEEGVLNIPFTAFGSGGSNDEMTFAWNQG